MVNGHPDPCPCFPGDAGGAQSCLAGCQIKPWAGQCPGPVCSSSSTARRVLRAPRSCQGEPGAGLSTAPMPGWGLCHCLLPAHTARAPRASARARAQVLDLSSHSHARQKTNTNPHTTPEGKSLSPSGPVRLTPCSWGARYQRLQQPRRGASSSPRASFIPQPYLPAAAQHGPTAEQPGWERIDAGGSWGRLWVCRINPGCSHALHGGSLRTPSLGAKALSPLPLRYAPEPRCRAQHPVASK